MYSVARLELGLAMVPTPSKSLEIANTTVQAAEQALAGAINAAIRALGPPLDGERLTSRDTVRYDLPVSGEGGLQPGVDLDNWVATEDLIEDR